jgi:glycerol-3-phosphate dehydrogenase
LNEFTFSLKTRDKDLRKLQQEKLDLLVIGGGITGAGIAWDASLRGMKVGLVEKKDFGWGTSSRSTKLVHGGLRYLKQGEIHLVREVGRERAILHQLAPHLVRPIHMMLPLYRGGALGRFSTSLGLWIYDRLAGVRKEERRTMFSREETQSLESLIHAKDLLGSGVYVEYMTDDARLTLDIIRSAAVAGATCMNYTQADHLHYESNRVTGVYIKDLSGKKILLKAKKIVNATGPWADQLRVMDKSRQGKRLQLTKGVHIVVPAAVLPIKQALYFDTEDGRMVFAIPRGEIVYIGTTDTLYEGDIDHPMVSREDSRYLLRAVQRIFPDLQIQTTDIISSWAGLRPLIHQEGKVPSELSRKDEIFISPTGLITIAGGKLTGFRKMAQKVVDLVTKQLRDELDLSFGLCITGQSPVMGGGEKGASEYLEQVNAWMDRVTKAGLPHQLARAWISTYGLSADQIIDELGVRLNPSRNILEREAYDAVLRYSWEKEMICRADDLLIRRTGFLFFQPDQFLQRLDQTIDFLAEKQGWNTLEKDKEQKRLIQLYQEATLNKFTLGRPHDGS